MTELVRKESALDCIAFPHNLVEHLVFFDFKRPYEVDVPLLL